MSKVSVLKCLAVLVLVNLDLNKNFLSLIWPDCSNMLYLPTYSVNFHYDDDGDDDDDDDDELFLWYGWLTKGI